MKLKQHLQRKLTMTVLQRQCLMIVTMLSTILLITIWPRFLNDALSTAWYVYVFLIAIFTIPLVLTNSKTS